MYAIKKITFKDHDLFHNQTIDFMKDDKISPFVIIYGENGTGKTQLLQQIYNIVSQPYYNKVTTHIPLSFYSMELLLDEKTITIENHNPQAKPSKLRFLYEGKEFPIEFSNNLRNRIKILNNSQDTPQNKKQLQVAKQSLQLMERLEKLQGYMGRYHNVNLNSISSTMSFLFSEEQQVSNKVQSPLFNFGQFIINAHQRDIEEYDQAILEARRRGKSKETVKKEDCKWRFKRIQNTVNALFPHKHLIEVDKNCNVLFKETNSDKLSNIRQLSSGEKQLLARGLELLKEKNTLEGKLVFIDEPEISLDPSWQKKMIKFYHDLCCNDKTQQQEAQILMATHSPFIVESADDNCKIINLNHDNTKGHVVAVDHKIETNEPIKA